MIIGTVKELVPQEYRVGITPDAAKTYIENGHTVYIEKDAGLNCGFSNQMYEEIGATILESASDVWEKSNMIIKVKEPTQKEFKYFRENLIIYAFMHLSSHKDLFKAVIDNKVTSVAYETVQDNNGRLVCLQPMSEIAGRVAVIEGAKYLQSTSGGIGKLISGTTGVDPANILIIGAGNAGLGALKMAYGIGANIFLADINEKRLKELKENYPNINTLISTDENIFNALKQADVVISTISLPGDKTPQIIKRKYYKEMRKGAVIIDIAIDQGGSTEDARVTSLSEPTYVIDGIIHFNVPNIPSSVHATATVALNNATLDYGLEIANSNLEDLNKLSLTLRRGINTYKGKSTNEAISNVYGYKYTKII